MNFIMCCTPVDKDVIYIKIKYFTLSFSCTTYDLDGYCKLLYMFKCIQDIT